MTFVYFLLWSVACSSHEGIKTGCVHWFLPYSVFVMRVCITGKWTWVLLTCIHWHLFTFYYGLWHREAKQDACIDFFQILCSSHEGLHHRQMNLSLINMYPLMSLCRCMKKQKDNCSNESDIIDMFVLCSTSFPRHFKDQRFEHNFYNFNINLFPTSTSIVLISDMANHFGTFAYFITYKRHGWKHVN